jgi:hypothetical protein
MRKLYPPQSPLQGGKYQVLPPVGGVRAYMGKFFHGSNSRQHGPPRHKCQGYKAAPDQSGWANVSPIHKASFCRPANSHLHRAQVQVSPVGAATEKTYP